jgi:hypothetical protein
MVEAQIHQSSMTYTCLLNVLDKAASGAAAES